MNKRDNITLALLLRILICSLVHLPAAHGAETIKVGVFQNKPIVYHEQQAKGLFVEVLTHVASQENWQIVYIPCKLKQCEELLKKGDIQLMTSVGKNERRLQNFSFSKEPIWTFWGTVYARETGIASVLDLEGKTIAVRQGNKITRGLKQLLTDFKVSATYLEFTDYTAAFEAVENKKADAVAVNNTYALTTRQQQKNIHKTPIAFNPFSAYFAAAKGAGNDKFLDTIDKHAKALKDDQNSVYHTFLDTWFSTAKRPFWSLKQFALYIGLPLLLFILMMSLYHYRLILKVNKKLKASIAERQQTEQELQQQKELLQKALSVGNMGSWEIDLPEQVMQWSEEINTIFAFTSTTPHTFDAVTERIHPDDMESFSNTWEKALKKGEFEIQHRILRDGETRWIKAKGKIAFDDQHNPIKGTGFAQDITEEKLAKDEKKALEKKLNQAQKLESIGRLAGGVAHDLNNLLTPIVGYSEMVYEDLPPGDSARDMTMQIIKASNGAAELVRQLLAFSRKQVLDYKPVELNQALTNFEKLLRRTIPENIEITTSAAAREDVVMADIGQIEQVIMNLAINATDAMPTGGHLTISTALEKVDPKYLHDKPEIPTNQQVTLTVVDTGHGMDEATRLQIFEPFFSTKGELGTGLGLATVYGIIKQHKGFIGVASQPGSGTTFKVYLPPSNLSPTTVPTREKEEKDLRGKETLLLVEDNPHVLDTIHTMLKRYGYPVLTAHNGKEALKLLQAPDTSVDLLVTDMIMPDVSGIELHQKAQKILPEIKALYMSGYTDNVITGHEKGTTGFHFIQKPFSDKDIAQKIRFILDEQ